MKIVSALIISIIVATICFAQETKTQTSSPVKQEVKTTEVKRQKIKQNVYEGVIEKVETNEQTKATTISVKEKGKKDVVKTFTLPVDIKITLKDKTIAATELKNGDKVKIKYEGEIDSPSIKEIKVIPQPVKKAATKKEEKK